MTRRQRDAIIRNGRPTKQERLPSAIVARASKAAHMGKERELLAKRRMLENDARKKYDELDEIFQQIVETDQKIEKQRQKQLKEREQ